MKRTAYQAVGGNSIDTTACAQIHSNVDPFYIPINTDFLSRRMRRSPMWLISETTADEKTLSEKAFENIT